MDIFRTPDETMSVTIVLFYVFITAFMLMSYSPKPRKVLETIKGYLLQLLHLSNNNNNNNPAMIHVPPDENVTQRDRVYTVWDIPGPKRWPLVGTKWIYMTGQYKMAKMHDAFVDLYKRYGKIVLEVDRVPVVNLFDQADIEKVLKYPSRYPYRPPTEIVEYYRRSRPDRFASTGIVNTQGEQWHELRVKLTSGITSRKVLLAFIPSLNEICDDFVELIRRKRDTNNCVKDFQDVANTVGLEIICCLVLGRRMGFLSGDRQKNEKFGKLAEAVKSTFVYISQSYYGFKLWKYLPTKLYQNYVHCEEIIYDTIAEIVNEALREEQQECSDDDVRSIFLSILQTEGLDTKDKIAGIIDLIHAAIETFSNTLSFLLNNLSHHPDKQSKISQEFISTEPVTSTEMTNAIFTKACIKESYRISPTTPCLARILEEDFLLSGYHLKAGTVVLCHTRVACQSEQNFRSADKFIPERWLEQVDENQNVYKLDEPGASLVLPFGTGRRMCPGHRIIDIELTLVMAKIFQQFEVEYHSDLDTQFQFLLAPGTPIEIIFRDRN